ncbi:MAG TPA: DUF4893 domain-containing protein [Allosphingosinicella sp.]|nr:DUF4893 domain-containing protein [Allosphingosinicella sp.]
MPQLRPTLLLPLAAALAACQTAAPPRAAAPGASVVIEAEEDWRGTALPEHASITEDMPPLFAGLAAVARPGPADRELLDAELLLRAPAPAPGAYRCRLVRLPAPAAAARRERGAAARPAFCFVGADGERLSLTLETPARRLGGYLWPAADARRMVFLGAGFSPPARTAPAYSAAPGVNTAGLFERTGDFRYRLTVRGPSPGTLDVYELVAAPAQR